MLFGISDPSSLGLLIILEKVEKGISLFHYSPSRKVGCMKGTFGYYKLFRYANLCLIIPLLVLLVPMWVIEGINYFVVERFKRRNKPIVSHKSFRSIK